MPPGALTASDRPDQKTILSRSRSCQRRGGCIPEDHRATPDRRLPNSDLEQFEGFVVDAAGRIRAGQARRTPGPKGWRQGWRRQIEPQDAAFDLPVKAGRQPAATAAGGLALEVLPDWRPILHRVWRSQTLKNREAVQSSTIRIFRTASRSRNRALSSPCRPSLA